MFVAFPFSRLCHFLSDLQRPVVSNSMPESSSPLDRKANDIGEMKGGLIFLKTRDRQSLVRFYVETIQMKVWLEQPDITILSHGNFILGFHHRPDQEPETSGMYTFVYPSKEEVDAMYQKFQRTTADGPPRINERYRIYQFFAKDPEGRQLEFQAFLHPLQVVSSQV